MANMSYLSVIERFHEYQPLIDELLQSILPEWPTHSSLTTQGGPSGCFLKWQPVTPSWN